MEPNSNNTLALRIGFRQVKGLSQKDAECIISERKNGYRKVYDVWQRSGVSHSVISKIVKADCFHSLGLKRHEALWEANVIKSNNRMPLFEILLEGESIKESKINLPRSKLGSSILKDYNSLNFTIKGHPLALLRPILDKQ